MVPMLARATRDACGEEVDFELGVRLSFGRRGLNFVELLIRASLSIASRRTSPDCTRSVICGPFCTSTARPAVVEQASPRSDLGIRYGPRGRPPLLRPVLFHVEPFAPELAA